MISTVHYRDFLTLGVTFRRIRDCWELPFLPMGGRRPAALANGQNMERKNTQRAPKT